ncbi:MAG: tetratricopeptide repeat protein [Deltaproteobacteria bacterium]|nr:tetratricopeptide repeat protein [Deltaproteobacteria bacterium]MBW2658654.1 tetratricopeptide repeat protein [Deltaproteobacteria bacterium]
MSSKLQNINSITSAADNTEDKKPVDPLQALLDEGKRFLENNETGQAAVALHNALLGFEEKNDEVGIANACNQLGLVCLARKENEKALAYFDKVYKICDKSNDRMSLLAVSKQCVVAYRGLGQYDNAIDTCLEMLDWYQDNRDPQGAVVTLELMADIYEETESYDLAADACRTAASIHKNFKHDTIAGKLIEKAEKLKKKS